MLVHLPNTDIKITHRGPQQSKQTIMTDTVHPVILALGLCGIAWDKEDSER